MDDFFENIYKNASNGDLASVPWATLDANIYLEEYLKKHVHVSNKKAIVIGCGLGDDAKILSSYGYSVDAFDLSVGAIDICKKRFPGENINFFVQNLLELPESLKNKYDFVYEGLTIQSIQVKYKNDIINAICSLNKKGGKLFLYASLQDDDENYGGPPWPLYRNDLEQIIKNYFKNIFYKEKKEDERYISSYRCIALYEKL